MKLFIGGFYSCDVHSERKTIENLARKNNIELVNTPVEADIILIIDTCIGSFDFYIEELYYLWNILDVKKENAKVIVSGCISDGVTFKIHDKIVDVLNQVEIIKTANIIEYMANLLGITLKNDLKIPYYANNFIIRVSVNRGCTNNCSFCKANYQNFYLKSYSLEQIERLRIEIEEKGFNFLNICSSNLSVYGLDLYNKQMAHKAIKNLTSPSNIKYTNVGALINYYPELITEIIENEKIKSINTSLESGSERIYNTMNRPISLENWIKIVKLIKNNRPDILIKTEIILGYPNESIEDIKRTVDVIKELDLYVAFNRHYINSPTIPSSELKQHTYEYKLKSENYYNNLLEEHNTKVIEKIYKQECYISYCDNEKKLYYLLYPGGIIEKIKFNQLDKLYTKGSFIKGSDIKNKQYAKRYCTFYNN